MLASAADAGSPKWDGAMSSILPAGDVDLDGRVTAADLAIVRANMGSTNAWWRNGDLNHDGVVNQADVDILDGVVEPIVDTGFERQAVGSGRYQYGSTGSSWEFHDNAGLSGNSSAFTSGDPSAPEGT